MNRYLSGPAIGVAIGAESVSAIALHYGCIVWSREELHSHETQLSHVLITLLRDLPRARFRRPTVHASVGPAAAQLRNVAGPGWAKDAKLARAIVQENAVRFFLVNGIALLATPVGHEADGNTWVGAIEQPVVDALSEACRVLRLELATIAPAAAVLGHAMPDKNIVWHDGELALIASYDDARLRNCRRVRSSDAPPFAEDTPAFHPELMKLGDGYARFAPAFGAASAGRTVQAALRPKHEAASSRSHTATAATICISAWLLALLIPPVVVRHQSGERAAERAANSRVGTRALMRERELNAAVMTIRELNAFAKGRRSATLLLANLTQSVVSPTMLLDLQVDTLGGTLVALTPRASSLMAMLDSVPTIADPRITGPVTQDGSMPAAAGMMMRPGQNGGVVKEPIMERVTVRFSWSDRPRTVLGSMKHR